MSLPSRIEMIQHFVQKARTSLMLPILDDLQIVMILTFPFLASPDFTSSSSSGSLGCKSSPVTGLYSSFTSITLEEVASIASSAVFWLKSLQTSNCHNIKCHVLSDCVDLPSASVVY